MTEALWWTIDGWKVGEEPDSYTRGWDAAGDGDWYQAFRRAGYERLGKWNLHLLEYQDELEIWRLENDDEHMLVMFGDRERFFVQRVFSPAFWTDKFPALQGISFGERQVEAAEQMARAVLGFVRHGHGEHVIDEHGTESMEERHRTAQRWRREEEERKRGAAAPKAPDAS